MGTVGVGWGGSKMKIRCGVLFCPKMMILQGVGHPIPKLGVRYANYNRNWRVYDTRACA